MTSFIVCCYVFSDNDATSENGRVEKLTLLGVLDWFFLTCLAKEGHFVCRGCKTPLYSAKAKFDSGCGWPAFDKCYKGSINTHVDSSMGMRRVEITCATCGGHLGHVFEGERMTDTNERHCVNSVS